jgi:DnaJ domain
MSLTRGACRKCDCKDFVGERENLHGSDGSWIRERNPFRCECLHRNDAHEIKWPGRRSKSRAAAESAASSEAESAAQPRLAADISVQSPAPHFINYYTVLEVGQAASEDEIVEAVLKLRRHWHVRSIKSTDSDAKRFAEDRVRSISEAAELLLDPAQRAIHDRAIAEHERHT